MQNYETQSQIFEMMCNYLFKEIINQSVFFTNVKKSKFERMRSERQKIKNQIELNQVLKDKTSHLV
jgi:hypothetical protein